MTTIVVLALFAALVGGLIVLSRRLPTIAERDARDAGERVVRDESRTTPLPHRGGGERESRAWPRTLFVRSHRSFVPPVTPSDGPDDAGEMAAARVSYDEGETTVPVAPRAPNRRGPIDREAPAHADEIGSTGVHVSRPEGNFVSVEGATRGEVVEFLINLRRTRPNLKPAEMKKMAAGSLGVSVRLAQLSWNQINNDNGSPK